MNRDRLLIAFLMGLIVTGCQPTANKNMNEGGLKLKLNNIQVIGSHNSYKRPIEPALLKILQEETSETFQSLQYGHIPLADQLENHGLRNLEIDVLYDPEGGQFAKPYGLELLKQQNTEAQPYDPDGVMNDPGFKVLHVPDIDFRSSCLRLTDCLQEIKDWSDAYPQHLPICITFNAKSGQADRPEFAKLLPYTPEAYDALDSEILTVFPKERIVTPDDVRGDYETLDEAVKLMNWPEIDEVRGKIILVLDERGQKMDDYVKGHPSLKGRLMFVRAAPGTPEAGFMIMNDPIADQDSIKKLVKAGYMVRTRADADTEEARNGDYTKFKAALSSGAHFITTDYYLEDKSLGTGYQIQLPDDGIARCNPVFVTEGCKGEILE
ncbi:phosphatidylinositol-specific phospholipase C1-like protein [Reichenbachiella sp. MALMAid0571]|uniref:phosphatidylinositol-specific phospholipase C1-like protein n=1 Tax=Reichenbachiella sp. MALMAid0571 TaxID=3143939 RepID=UPI0032E02710